MQFLSWADPAESYYLPALYLPRTSMLYNRASFRSAFKPRAASLPNYFLALQVSHHEGVTQAITKVHDSIYTHSPALAGALVESAAAHMTVGVMTLDDGNDSFSAYSSFDASMDESSLQPPALSTAVSALSDLRGVLAAAGKLQPLTVPLQGLNTFNDKVLFLEVPECEARDSLLSLGALVRSHFLDAGLLHPEGGRSFVPHVTVAKMSKIGGGRGGFKRQRGEGSGGVSHRGGIPAESYAAHADIIGGEVAISEVQLCRMRGRPPGQYYLVEGRLRLSGT